jgi:predicted unusual protein kinase regulating ubiquinone biosynthesis (AarF/ABC1/UbiB family)
VFKTDHHEIYVESTQKYIKLMYIDTQFHADLHPTLNVQLVKYKNRNQ